VHVKGVDAANVPDGQYVPAGHTQRKVDRGEGFSDAVLRCHEKPQIDDDDFDEPKTVARETGNI
jgi:hypothetical protein